MTRWCIIIINIIITIGIIISTNIKQITCRLSVSVSWSPVTNTWRMYGSHFFATWPIWVLSVGTSRQHNTYYKSRNHENIPGAGRAKNTEFS